MANSWRGRIRDGARFALPYMVLVPLIIVDLALGPTEPIHGTYGAAPLVAAIISGSVATAVAGLVATAAAVIAGSAEMTSQSAALARQMVVALMSVGALLLSWQRRRRTAELAEARLIAKVAQRAVLGSVPPRVGDLRLAAAYVSAARGAAVGGDLYEVVPCGEGVRLIVGDVRGKGLDAVRLAAIVLGAFREAAADEDDLCRVATRMDNRLRRFLSSEDFVTAALAQIDESGVELVSCGHPPPLLVRDAQSGLLEPPITLPLGLGADPQSVFVPLKPRDRLLFYTDGFIEARDRRRRFVGLEQLTSGMHEDGDPDQAIGSVLARLRRLAGPRLNDDLALLLVELDGPPPEG